MDEIIVDICACMPMSKEELASVLNIHEVYLRTQYLTRLLKEGRLRLTIPEMRNHPNQKYTAKKG